MAVFFALIYTSVLSFTNVSVGLLSERWLEDDGNQELVAGRMVGIVWLIAGIFTPIFGYGIDIIGRRGLIVIIDYFIKSL